MIAGILLVLLALVALWLSFKKLWDSDPEYFGVALVAIGFVAAILMVPTIRFFDGFLQRYGQGERLGFVTKCSTRGVLFVTNEVEFQVGTGQLAAVQEPFSMSCPDKATFERIRTLEGRKLRIHYNQWLLMPYRMGDTNYEIVGVTVLDEAGAK